MGGLASDVEGSPFENWNRIRVPYATGDFHAGAGEQEKVRMDIDM